MTVPMKSVILNSQRGSKPKVDPIKMPAQSVHTSSNHSRYLKSYKESSASIVIMAWLCHVGRIWIKKHVKVKNWIRKDKDSTIEVTLPFLKNQIRTWRIVSKLICLSYRLSKMSRITSILIIKTSIVNILIANMWLAREALVKYGV